MSQRVCWQRLGCLVGFGSLMLLPASRSTFDIKWVFTEALDTHFYCPTNTLALLGMLCVGCTSIFQVFVWFLQLNLLYVLLCRFLLWFILCCRQGLH